MRPAISHVHHHKHWKIRNLLIIIVTEIVQRPSVLCVFELKMQGNDMDAAMRTSGFSCTCRHADQDKDTNQAGDKHRGLNKKMVVMVTMIGMPQIWRHSRFYQLHSVCLRHLPVFVDGTNLTKPTLNCSKSLKQLPQKKKKKILVRRCTALIIV